MFGTVITRRLDAFAELRRLVSRVTTVIQGIPLLLENPCTSVESTFVLGRLEAEIGVPAAAADPLPSLPA